MMQLSQLPASEFKVMGSIALSKVLDFLQLLWCLPIGNVDKVVQVRKTNQLILVKLCDLIVKSFLPTLER